MNFVNFAVVASAHAADINYIYDELGRLRAVVDPNSDAAVYNYDAVGNLLSITRQASTLVSVIEFTPNSGPVGMTVTVYGTGFSATPSQNTVTFNGVTASVTSSTTTKIVTTVPASATTGPIAVTSPGGSATSGSVFTVTASTGAPTITGFNPSVGTSGTAVTVDGTNFETVPSKNTLRFNNNTSAVTSASATSLSTTVPAQTGSGRISVATPQGKAVSTADFFIPPAPYAAPDVQYTGRMSVDGASHTATISTAGKIGLVVFDGTAGQKVSLGVNAVTPGSGNDLYVFNPDGSTLTWTSNTTTNTNFHMTLPATGTYTLMLDIDGTNTGSASLTLSSEVNAGTIVIDGASATITTTRVGQRGYLTFSGTAGQKVSLGVNAITPTSLNDLYVLNPDGSTLTWTSNTTPNTNFHMTLPATGTYTFMLDIDGTNTGNATLTLSSEVDGGTVTTKGPSVPITISRVGQRARLTFGGTASQQAIVRLTGNSMGSVTVSLLKPDGTQLTWSTSSAASFDLSMQTLPTTGTYTILVDPASTNTGSINVAVIIPVSLTLSFNGKIRDRVGQGNAAINPDGSLDGTFTVTLPAGSGNRTVTSLDLRRSAGGVWDTLTNSFWVSGAASSLDDPLFNNSAGAVNLAVTDGGSFNIFASDQNNIYFNSGSVFTLTVNFPDGNFAIGNATLP
jgi:YD repeat-containing protein